ncbi:uncharacterized protein MCAP_0864-like [Magallana gigas]|uniref:uncharacterized protein MCAP_0864-like n=1 Tax=Magallana gigas TaxID=29159 RepID=UPI00334036B4
MPSKLRAVRSGQRSAVTRLLRKLEESISEENNSEDTETIIALLEEKQDTLEKINSQILQELSSEEEIQMENRYSVEYMLHLRLKLAELTKSASSTKTLENVHQSTSINLNVNAQEFAQSNDTSQDKIGKPKIHNTMDKKEDDDDIWDLQSLRRAIKETNKLNTKLQKRETAQSRTNKQKKSAFNTVNNKEKEDQEQEDMVDKLKSEILQLRRENFRLRRKSSFKSKKIQKIQRENSDLEQKMKSLEDLNNQLQAQTQNIQSNVEPCSETFTTSQEMASKDTADLRHYLDELELRVINLEMGKNVTALEEIMKQNPSLMTQLWKLDPYTHNNLEKYNFYRALGENNIHQRHYHKRTGTTFNEFKIGKLVSRAQ